MIKIIKRLSWARKKRRKENKFFARRCHEIVFYGLLSQLIGLPKIKSISSWKERKSRTTDPVIQLLVIDGHFNKTGL